MSQSLFIGLTSKENGLALSLAAWALSKPYQLQNPDDITTTVGNVIKHPDLEKYAWSFSDDSFLIHPQANPRTLDNVLEPLVSMGILTQSDLDDTASKIYSYANSMHNILDIMPQPILNSVKDYETMKLNGWFPS
jgi:hypothetical protein